MTRLPLASLLVPWLLSLCYRWRYDWYCAVQDAVIRSWRRAIFQAKLRGEDTANADDVLDLLQRLH